MCFLKYIFICYWLSNILGGEFAAESMILFSCILYLVFEKNFISLKIILYFFLFSLFSKTR